MIKYNEMSDEKLFHYLYMYEKRLAVTKALLRKLNTCTIRIANDDIIRSLIVEPNGHCDIITDATSIIIRSVIKEYENNLEAIYEIMRERNLEVDEDNLCDAIDLYMIGD
jgi:hypothetical protein